MIATIEPPLALLEEQKEAVLGDAIESPKMVLCLVQKILNSFDVAMPVHESRGVVDPDVVKVRDIQSIIALEGVCVHDAIRQDHEFHYGEKSCTSGVGDHNREYPPTVLLQVENRYFASSSSPTFPFPGSFEVALIDFDLTLEWECLSHLIGNDLPQSGEEYGRRVLVDPDQLSCSTCSCASDELLNEPGPLLWAEPTFPLVPDAILA